jgi:hypothetical protein
MAAIALAIAHPIRGQYGSSLTRLASRQGSTRRTALRTIVTSLGCRLAIGLSGTSLSTCQRAIVAKITTGTEHGNHTGISKRVSIGSAAWFLIQEELQTPLKSLYPGWQPRALTVGDAVGTFVGAFGTGVACDVFEVGVRAG